jgi:hypothetical protein
MHYHPAMGIFEFIKSIYDILFGNKGERRPRRDS